MVQATDAGRGVHTVAFVGVGSNIHPRHNVRRALDALAQRASMVAASTFYRTTPVGSSGSADFYNGVVALSLPGGRPAVVSLLAEVEGLLARIRTEDANAARTIDLDLLLLVGADGQPVSGVPVHPDVESRAFVALPLLEVAGDLVLPGSKLRLSQVARGFPDPPGVPLLDFTDELKRAVWGEGSGGAG